MKCILDKQEIDLLHNQFYREKITNRRGTKNLIPTDIRVGDFYFRTHPQDTCISDCLRTGILFEKFIVSYVRQFIDPTKNILDIGANIGVHSVVYSNYLTTGQVYAFEPQKVVYDILVQNIDINNCSNVTTFNIGLSDTNSTLFMNAYYDEKQNQGAFSICSETDHTKGIHIECKKADDLNLQNIGYVKIDVEGHELHTLKGMKNILIQNKPAILIEVHETSPTKAEVFSLLEELGYSQYHKLSHCDYLFPSQ